MRYIAGGLVEAAYPAVEADEIESPRVVMREELAKNAQANLVESIVVGPAGPEVGDWKLLQRAARGVVADLAAGGPGG